MARKLKSDLSVRGINNLIDELNDYKSVYLQSKTNELIERLVKRGITVAENHVYNAYKPYVTFAFNQIDDGIGELKGTNRLLHKIWYHKNGSVSGEYDIAPLFMAEFGAGKYAPSEWRGSLGKNGLKDEWFWYDSNGDKHSSEEDDLIKPTHPMHNAYIEMMNCYKEVAKEVFV